MIYFSYGMTRKAPRQEGWERNDKLFVVGGGGKGGEDGQDTSSKELLVPSCLSFSFQSLAISNTAIVGFRAISTSKMNDL